MEGTVVRSRTTVPFFLPHSMSIRQPSIRFRDAEHARLNWLHLERTAPASVINVLRTLLRSSPDPDSALNYFERFHSEASPSALYYLQRNPTSLTVLLPIFSQSHFLSETLVQHPELLEWLHRDKRIEFIKSKEDLLEELSRFEAALSDKALAERLALFKRREYLRIVLRDVTRIATLAETTWELSTLAEVILEEALRQCDQQLKNRYGAPRALDSSGRIIPSEFVVMALGKLGGKELNYSSDIDLIYLYSEDGETEGVDSRPETRISNQEYFIKLSSALTKAVSQMTPSGWAFRVDLRLRPQGREGFLARSLTGAIEYYEHSAESWELQALLKARPVAGNVAVGKEFIRKLQSRIFPTEEKSKIVETIGRMRTMLDRKLGQVEPVRFNVKLSRGTIRDIEFITQCLARLHGADDPWVREANTLLDLRRLQDNNYFSRADFVVLASAYEFFRIIEHRLQLDRGEQTHTFPAQAAEQDLLAARMGFESLKQVSSREALLHSMEYHRGAVARIYDRILGESLSMFTASAPETSGTEQLAVGVSPGTGLNADPSMALLSRNQPGLAEAVARAAIPPVGQKSFTAFLEAVAPLYVSRPPCQAHPDCTDRLEHLFGSGVVMGEMAAKHPEWVFPLLTRAQGKNLLDSKRGRGARRKSSVARQSSSPKLNEAASIRRIREETQQRVFGILWGDIYAKRLLKQTLADLSKTAERAVGEALSIARVRVAQKSVAMRKILQNRNFRFAIFGLGRLATHELDVGSDLDLIFVSDYSFFRSRDLPRETAFAVAENVLSILTSYTREGPLYSVDLRLRPSGNEGELVQDAEHLTEYFRTAAQVWESVAYLKLRRIAGDPRLARTVQKHLRETFPSFLQGEKLKTDLMDIRTRLEQSSPSGVGLDLKQGVGGMYDIDFALAYCHLRGGKSYRTGATMLEIVRGAEKYALLPKDNAEVLCTAVELYRLLDHSFRMLKGKAAKSFDLGLIEELPPSFRQRIWNLVCERPCLRIPNALGTPAELMKVFIQTAQQVRATMNSVFSL